MKTVKMRSMNTLKALMILLVFVMCNDMYSYARQKVTDGTYFFDPAACFKFVIRNKMLTLKVTETSAYIEQYIEQNENPSFKKKKMVFPVAKDCKYYVVSVDQRTLETTTRKINYKTIKNNISSQRRSFRNYGYGFGTKYCTLIIVNNGKVVKIKYFTR